MEGRQLWYKSLGVVEIFQALLQYLFSGLKEELKDHYYWLQNSYGKYSVDELNKRMNFDVMTSPPGYSRRKITFGKPGIYILT